MSRPTEGGVDEAEGSRLTVLRYKRHLTRAEPRSRDLWSRRLGVISTLRDRRSRLSVKNMKNLVLPFLLFSIILLPSFAQAEPPAEQPIRVLIVDDLGPGYYHMLTATTLRDIIRQDKRFDVVLVQDAEVLGTDLPFDYDVVLLHFKNYKIPKRDAAMKANLEKFVDDGGGVFVFHFACGAFEDWPGYEKIAGRVWDPKKPPHDPYGLFNVHVVDTEHPITKGLGDFETYDELYTCLKDSEVPIHVLADATSKVDGKPHPMAFVLEKGRGRIFHTALGHDAKSLSAAGFQAMIRNALTWCAKRDDLPMVVSPPQEKTPVKEEPADADARIKEIAASVPEGAKLSAYLDCGGPGRFEQGVKIVAPEGAKPWIFRPESKLEGVPLQQLSVLFDADQLPFLIEGLDRAKKYQLNVVWWDFDASGRSQSLIVQSSDRSMVKILRPGVALPDFKLSGLPPKTVTLSLPLAFVRDGKLLVSVKNEGGANAVVSEIWINELP